MPKTTDINLLEELTTLRSTYPWIMLIEFEKDFGTFTRCACNNENVSWNGEEWFAYPFKLAALSQTSTGSLSSTNVSFFNTLEISRRLSSSVIGSGLTLYFLNMKYKDNYQVKEDYPLQFSYKVIGASISDYVTLRLGASNYLLTKIPSKKYVRDFCNFLFLGEHCWLKPDTFTSLKEKDTEETLPVECNKSYQTCKKYWEFGLLNQPDVTPKYIGFGGFPTIDRGDISYV